MEKILEDKLHSIMARPGVVGCVISDDRGLCLASKGIGNAEMSGMLCSVADTAKKIDSSSQSYPLVRLESDKGYCLVQKKASGFTLAIFKKYPNT